MGTWGHGHDQAKAWYASHNFADGLGHGHELGTSWARVGHELGTSEMIPSLSLIWDQLIEKLPFWR